jgi:hypothetical protein
MCVATDSDEATKFFGLFEHVGIGQIVQLTSGKRNQSHNSACPISPAGISLAAQGKQPSNPRLDEQRNDTYALMSSTISRSDKISKVEGASTSQWTQDSESPGFIQGLFANEYDDQDIKDINRFGAWNKSKWVEPGMPKPQNNGVQNQEGNNQSTANQEQAQFIM